MNIGVHISFWIGAFPDICPRVGLQENKVILLFSYLRNLHNVLHSGYTKLHFHLQCRSVPFFPIPLPAFSISRLFNYGHSECWEVIANSLIIDKIEHLFMCLSAICMSSLEKCLFRSSDHFSIQLFAVLILSYELFVYFEN